MITGLALIAILFLGLRLLVIMINVLFYYLNTGTSGNEAVKPGMEPEKPDMGMDKPDMETNKPGTGTRKISILIPARNEEAHISKLLDGLLIQDDQNMEIWVCDDHSTDQTPAILEQYSSRHPQINWFGADALQAGWTGKNAACYQLAQKASGEILLFLDADMEISGDILSRMRIYPEKKRIKLLSIFPRQRMQSQGERATIPVMNWILLSLLPLPMVRYSPRSSFAAANGQFMMFQAPTYYKLQPHAILRSSPVEDIGIMKLYKKEGYRCITLLGDDRVRCRMYTGYREATAGFSKNVLHYFSENLIWLSFFVLFSTFGLAFIGMWSLPALLIAIAGALLGRILISLISHQPVLVNLYMFPLQHISFLLMVWKALRQRSKGTLEWKGREISAS